MSEHELFFLPRWEVFHRLLPSTPSLFLIHFLPFLSEPSISKIFFWYTASWVLPHHLTPFHKGHRWLFYCSIPQDLSNSTFLNYMAIIIGDFFLLGFLSFLGLCNPLHSDSPPASQGAPSHPSLQMLFHFLPLKCCCSTGSTLTFFSLPFTHPLGNIFHSYGFTLYLSVSALDLYIQFLTGYFH